MSKVKQKRSLVSETAFKCFRCGRQDTEAVLFGARYKGENKWVCAQCLPYLIHGG